MEYKGCSFPEVEIDKDLTNDERLYLIINEAEYPTPFDQVTVINSIELISDNDIIFYTTDGVGYFTAKEFRTAHGFNNEFFENNSEEFKWSDIVFKLLDDPMIKSCGCDGLMDANNVLKGLLGMSELLHSSKYFTKDFILEAINESIKARNRYCWMNGAAELPLVKLENNNFIWEGNDND